MPNRLKAVIKNNGDSLPFHTNSEHGQRHRLTLTFIGPLLCIFNGGATATTLKFYTKNFIEYIYEETDIKLSLVTVNNRLIIEIEIDLSCHPIPYVRNDSPLREKLSILAAPLWFIAPPQ